MICFDTPIQMSDNQCQLMMDIVKENQPVALVNSRLGDGYGHFDVSIDNGKTPSVSEMTSKQQTEIINIQKAGIQKIVVQSIVMAVKSSRFKFKGLELVPVN